MTTRRRSRRGSRTGSSRRPMHWQQYLLGAALTDNQISFGDLTTDRISQLTTVPGPQTGTIRRLVGTLSINNVGVAGASQFALGISVVNMDVLNSPTNTTVPLPISDTDQDWYYWMGREVDLEASNGKQFDFDIRSSRRLRAGFGLILVLETGVVAPTTLSLEFQARGLWTSP